jgi:hypothetical protein
LKKYNFTIEELMETFTYDPLSGDIRWAKSPNIRIKVGAIAGTTDKRSNRRVIEFKGKKHFAHRFAWMLHNKELILDEKLQVDHINHDSLDNRACNLRLVTPSENQQNKRKYRNSKSKYKGVSWDENAGKWRARISINGKELYAGIHVEEDGTLFASSIESPAHDNQFRTVFRDGEIIEQCDIYEVRKNIAESLTK